MPTEIAVINVRARPIAGVRVTTVLSKCPVIYGDWNEDPATLRTDVFYLFRQ